MMPYLIKFFLALIAGVLVGPSCLGWVGETDFLVKAAEIGVIILMFNAGMDTDLDELKTTGFASFVIALIGVIVPLLGGMGCYLAGDYAFLNVVNIRKSEMLGRSNIAEEVCTACCGYCSADS